MKSTLETREQKSFEQLVQDSARVAISYVIPGEIGDGGGHLELSGAGVKSLSELRKGFGKKGVDAFNRKFLTDGFLQEIKKRSREIVELIGYREITFEEDRPRMEEEVKNESESLNAFLEKIRNGKGVRIAIGDPDYKERRRKPVSNEEVAYILLRMPSNPKASEA